MGSLSMVMEIPFLLLLPTICYSGLSQGFIYGTIPPLIINKSAKFLLFAFYGFISACSSIIFGKLSDYLGRRLLIFAIGALVHMIVFGLLLIVWTPPIDENRFEIFVIIIACLSMGDAIYMTQFYAVLSILYGETRPTDAFACMKAFQAGFTAISFIEQVYVPFSVQILCLIIVLSLSLITLIYEHYAIISLNTGKTIMSMENQNQNKVETEQEAKIPLATLNNSV
jgi:MFS family permease